MKVITSNPVIVNGNNLSNDELYSNFPDVLSNKPNPFGQSSTNKWGTTNTKLGDFHVDMPTSTIESTLPTNTKKKPSSNQFFKLEKSEAEKDFLTQKQLFGSSSNQNVEKPKKPKITTWWSSKTNLQKGLIISSGAVVLSLTTFLIYKLITKK